MIVRFVKALCPQQAIDAYTPDAWHEVIGHLEFDAARNAVIAVKHSQPFVDPSDIIREASRAESSKPYDRTVADALADNRPELEGAPRHAAPPEFTQAIENLKERMKLKAEQAMAVDREAERKANAWLDYRLSGKLPPQMPLSGPPHPRWVQLPGDPPELREWLVRQSSEQTGANA